MFEILKKFNIFNIFNLDGYMKPYIAGVFIGLVLLAAFIISGRGLGSTGAMTRAIIAVEKLVAPEYINENPYTRKYGGGDKNPLNNWLIFQALGVILGGAYSGFISGRLKKEINHGPRISARKRLFFAFLGGAIFAFGARLGRGCTSGVALTGGATLALGSWVTMFCIFIGAYALAYFVKRLWI